MAPTTRPTSKAMLPQPTARKRLPRVRQVPALSRGIAILRLLGQSNAPLGVHAIARQLGLVPSTCLHILRVLVDEHLIAVDADTKKYAVAAGLAALARTALRGHTFASAVRTDLEDLARTYRATAIGVEAIGLDTMVVVALARAVSPLGVQVDIGSRFPALISATGRCVVAFGSHPWSEVQKRFQKLKWDAPPSLADWRADIQATQRLGYAIDDGQYIRGVSIIAAPVRMVSGSINTLVVVGVSEQMRRTGLQDIGEDLYRRAALLSVVLGGEPLVRQT